MDQIQVKRPTSNSSLVEALQIPMARRNFLQLIGLGATGLVLGKLLAACGSSSDSGTTGCGTTSASDLCYEFTTGSITDGAATKTFKVKIDNPHGHELTVAGVTGTNVQMSAGSHPGTLHNTTWSISSLAIGASSTVTTAGGTADSDHDHNVTFTRLS